ncbi:MAG: SDR family NAD(P)-dependent oxidoreductase [Thermoleophilia bacterium]|nr:SDR family NAD(P)-dependent oxidoreductase [Thermoleophilia bacterium]
MNDPSRTGGTPAAPRLAIVTGATSGIGLAISRRLAARGMRVILVGRDAGRLEAARRAVGDAASAVPLDVADPGAVAAFCDRVRREYARVDLLVCNAGIPGRRTAPRTDPALARRVMGVNFHGTADVTVGLWPALVAAGGTVVNIVSVAGTVATAYDAPYTASKHAALAWSRALTASGAAEGVRVLTVNPGPVVTPGFPQTELVGRRLARRAVIDVDRCADEVMDALGRGRAEVFVPRWWRAAALTQALAPGLTRRLARWAWPRGRRGPA